MSLKTSVDKKYSAKMHFIHKSLNLKAMDKQGTQKVDT